ncbi:MAG: hypothetical protein AAF614_04475 [Chloroflexota bacterium]
MHSTILRGADFQIVWQGTAVSHHDFFMSLTPQDRLGVVAPNRFEAVGAVTLIMAYVTAFYDRHRAKGDDFFVYPNYFTFQRQAPVAKYSSFDIWPEHRNVLVGESADDLAAALTDRAINILFLPEDEMRDQEIWKVYRPDLENQLQRCFIYSFTGHLENADLIITSRADSLTSYGQAIFDSVADIVANEAKASWLAGLSDGQIHQSFREIDPNEALRRL